MASHLDAPFATDEPRPLLVGRAREQALLRAAVERARDGRGGLVLIGGEAGIGKSTLLADTAVVAEALDASVLVGHCYDLTETPPYGPWLDLIRQCPPTESEPAPPAALAINAPESVTSQEALFGQVRDWLLARSARHPLVVALDDLHWADSASLDLLRFLARQLTATSILVLATYRDEDLMPRNLLYPLLPALVREARPVLVDLHGLSPAAIRELVHRRYLLGPHDEDRLVMQLVERGDGNPFFIGELLRAFEEEELLRPDSNGWSLGDLAQPRLPRLLRQVIHGRLERLGDEAQKLLTIAAVIGQVVPLKLWATVAEVDEETLLDLVERAVEARIFAEEADGTQVRFSHALLRETLYSGLLAARRRAWHRTVAEALLSEPGADPAIIAYHFRQAGDPREAEWLVRAGERARTLYLPRVAIEHFTRALELACETSMVSLADVHRARGLAYETLGEFDRARADLGAALALARSAGNRRGEWQGLLDLGLLWEGHDYRQAGSCYQQALDLARTIAEPDVLASSLNRIGNWESNVERPREALGHQQEALALLRASGDRRGMVTTLDLLATGIWGSGQPDAAVPVWSEAAALCREIDDRQTLISCLTYLMVCGGTYATEAAVHSLRLDDAQTYGEEAVRLAQEINSRTGETWSRLMLAWCLGERGQYGQAIEHARHSLAVAEEIGHREWIGAAHFTLGAIELDLLAAPIAQEHLERALAVAQGIGVAWWITTATWTLARACLLQNDFPRAEALLTSVVGTESAPATLIQRGCWYARAELLLARRQPAEALVTLDQLIGAEAVANGGRFSPYVGLIRAQTIAALGRFGQAEASLHATRQAAAQHGARRLVWRIDATLATFYRDRQRPTEAAQAAQAGRALVDELAADVPDTDLRDTFRNGAATLLSSGPQHALHPEAYPTSLSAREVDVLRSLADGLSNAAIAERLSVSPRTVNSHLTSIYAKLGVNSRSAAVRFALDHGLR